MIRHVICMPTEDKKPHPFTGKPFVYHNAETANHEAAYPEWATKYKARVEAEKIARSLPNQERGYTVEKFAF